jgi:acyl-CoA hydrolase
LPQPRTAGQTQPPCEDGGVPPVAVDVAVAMIQPRDSLGVPLGPGIPSAFLHALGERDDFTELRVYGALLLDLYKLFSRPGVRYTSGFFGPAERLLADSGAAIEFAPADFRRFAPVLAAVRPRVMATAAAPPDADGWMSLSLHAGATVDELHHCGADRDRLLIVEVNDGYPRTLGLPPDHRHRLHVSEADVVVAGDRAPFALEDPPPSVAERAIAAFARSYVHDGATLQSGFGGVPSQVVRLLVEGDGGDYGVHSEMYTTALMDLQKAGKISNARKGQFDALSITTFALGTAELYEWLDGNETVRFLPVDVVNSPEVIARNHNMVTINGAIAVDLYGQVVADTRGGRQFSGIGGHEDFVSVSGLALEDRSLVCMPSTAVVGGAPVSRVVAAFDAGTVVTTPRHQLDVVITEHGVAELRGRTVRERAFALAEIADPAFRPELHEAAALR